jgi:hypothetical protein
VRCQTRTVFGLNKCVSAPPPLSWRCNVLNSAIATGGGAVLPRQRGNPLDTGALVRRTKVLRKHLGRLANNVLLESLA